MYNLKKYIFPLIGYLTFVKKDQPLNSILKGMSLKTLLSKQFRNRN